ncbi:MAG: NAD(P)-binding domain-containing protein [Duncaniella sp.]|nr:NAD(P)-binding domain-containing protein [Duncaniella sp.]
MNFSYKTAIIGGGAMGQAVAAGLVDAGAADASRIVISTPHPDRCPILGGRGIDVINDNRAAVCDASLVIIAVKPWILPDVIEEIKNSIDIETTEVSVIVAGVSVWDLERMWGDRIPASLSIAMPNTAMILRESMTFIVNANGKSELAEEVFNSLGKVMVIPERLLAGAMALASCGIAYAMRYVRAACEGGVELGFRASEAQAIIAQTLKGAVALLEQPGSHPETEIDKVTTPGGLTIRGLNEMEKNGFSAAVIAGLKASAK